jgi:feruloyl esterase
MKDPKSMTSRRTMRVRALAAVFAAAAALGTLLAIFGSLSSVAYARGPNQDVTCESTLGGGHAVTTIDGGLTVPENASCTLEFVNVTGDIRVKNGGSLVILGYREPSTIEGSVEAHNCVSALLEGNVTVKGDVKIANCSGAAANGFEGPGIVIKGTFVCQSNAGPCEAWLGDIANDVDLHNNDGISSDVSLNTIGGNLTCHGNSAAPTHNHGYNWVTGHVDGQCGADFSTTTTSIGTPASSGMDCAALATVSASGLPVPDTVITSATDTPAGGGLPERCVINGSFDTHISPVSGCTYHDNFQVALPLPAAWNHRFLLQGSNGGSDTLAATGINSGGASGSNTFGLNNGYAVAEDNEGFSNGDMAACGDTSDFQYFEDPGPVITNAFQAEQVTALMAKYLIAVYYGNDASRSYMGGCSGRGHDAMMWSQAFPQYFDGIFAGDPGPNLQTQELTELWALEQWLQVYTTANPPLQPPTPATVAAPFPQAPEQILYPAFPSSDWALLETALLQTCDKLDGVADGVIDNQPLCNSTFDPATATYVSSNVTYPLQCPGAKNATCLSPAQIQAIKAIHEGPRTADGRPVFAPTGAVAPHHSDNQLFGYLYDGIFGAASGLPGRDVGSSPTRAPGNWGSGLLQLVYASLSPAQPTFDPMTFNFTSDQALMTRSTPYATVTSSLDLSKFRKYGHKIIFYDAASDPGINTLITLSYYNGMANFFGGLQRVQSFSRLYVVPNMNHCSGGPATDQFDVLTPLTQWVEKGTAPGPLPATGVNFTSTQYGVGFVTGAPDNAPTTRSRPLCPYPQQARFAGKTTIVNGVPVAANSADLAVAANYICVSSRAESHFR